MDNKSLLKKAAQMLIDGGLVAFPTETVYGLGANAFDNDACLKIFQTKGRPSNNPLIVHVLSLKQAEELAVFNEDAYILSKLWPGPLTMVLHKKNDIKLASCVTAGLDTIAIRVPAHNIARELISYAGIPVAAPSANKSGKLTSTDYIHVKENFDNDDVFIINSTQTVQYGLESTIIDLTSYVPTILRFGYITPELIEQILGKKIEIASKLSFIKAPGMLHRHYAPKTSIKINALNIASSEVGLNFGDSKLDCPGSLNLSKKGDLAEAAANLFNFLYILDKYAQENQLIRIVIAPIPNESIGLAINDRLIRAAESSQ